MVNCKEIVQGIENGLLAIKRPSVSKHEFKARLDKFKNFSYKGLSDDEIFWMLTYVMFFSLGKRASMIEKKLPLLKQYLYGVVRVANLSDSELNKIITKTGFGLQVIRCRENAKKFLSIINHYGSFEGYLEQLFNIKDTDCSSEKLKLFHQDLNKRYVGIGETSGWHFITELGFNSLKPDSVIKRIFYRLGLISEEQGNIETIEVGRKFAEKLNLPMRYIDIIFVKLGQEGSSDLLGTTDGICLNQNPKCHLCPLIKFCNYKKTEPLIQHSNSNSVAGVKDEKPVMINEYVPGRLYSPQEFLSSSYIKGCSDHCQGLISNLFNNLANSNIDFYVEKRKRNDFILVAASRIHAKINKNILTVWTYDKSVDICIMPDPQDHFYTKEDLGEEFLKKVELKYLEIR